MFAIATRRERVVVSLDDDYSGPMGRCVGATALLNAELDRLSGHAVMTSRFARSVERDMDGVASSTKRADASINQLSGRLSILARLAAVLGPGLVPVGAVAVAGVAGLASQLGFAAAGGLSLVVALQGAGDAIKAVEAARLEPTVANLEKAEQAMAKLAPEAQEFVDRFQAFRPVLGDLQKSAAAGWFPGLTEALGSIETAAPTIERILLAVSTAGGDLIADGAKSLAGDRWAEFFDFIEAEAPDAITALGQAVGSLTHGLASLWMAMDPVNDGVRDWLVDITAKFDDWASSLDDGDVQGFFDYLSETGPKVAAAAGSIANAILQIAEAAAPLGGPVLESLTSVANAIAVIADSPAGTPIMTVVTALSAMALVSRGLTAGLGGVNGQLAAMGAQGPKTATALAMVHKAALALVGLQIGTEILDGLRDSAIGAAPDVEKLAAALKSADASTLTETLGGDLPSLLKASQSDFNELSAGVSRITDDTGIFGDALGAFLPQLRNVGNEAKQTTQAAESLDAAMAMLVATAGPDQAQKAFADMAKAQGLSANEQAQLQELLPKYNQALATTGLLAEEAGGATSSLSAQQEVLRSKLVAARDAAREGGKAFLDLSDSIAGPEFSMSKWIDAFEAEVRALAGWQKNLQDLREGGLAPGIIKELEAKGPAAAQAVEGLAKGGERAIERLNGAWREGQGELRQLGKDAKNAERDLQTLGGKDVKPKVGLETKGFENKRAAVDADLDRTGSKTAKPKADLDDKKFKSGISAMKSSLLGATRLGAKPKVTLFGIPGAEAQLASLTRPRTINIRTNVTGAPANKFASDPGPADGGTIPRFGGRPIRSAAGSTVPDDGGGYRDYLLYLLAPLEEVISNRSGQADEFRAELKDINRGMSRSEVAERMLKRGLAGGGTAGRDPSWYSALADQARSGSGGGGGRGKGDPWWLPAGMKIDDFELPKTLKGLNKALKQSQTALEREKNARDELASKMSSLQDAVSGKITSDLFGETEAWSPGGSFEDVMAILAGDISTGTQMQKDIAALQKKGLNGGALDALLAQGDAATIGRFAGLTPAQLDQYEKQYERRDNLATTTGKNASTAAYGPEFKVLDASVRRLEAKVGAVEKAIKDEHKEDRDSRNRGNSKGHRGRNGK